MAHHPAQKTHEPRQQKSIMIGFIGQCRDFVPQLRRQPFIRIQVQLPRIAQLQIIDCPISLCPIAVERMRRYRGTPGLRQHNCSVGRAGIHYYHVIRQAPQTLKSFWQGFRRIVGEYDHRRSQTRSSRRLLDWRTATVLAAQLCQQVGRVNRLRKDLELMTLRASLLQKIRGGGLSGKEQNLAGRQLGSNLDGGLDAGHPGHNDIRNQHVRPEGVHALHRSLAGVHCAGLKPCLIQDDRQSVCNDLFIICNQHPGFLCRCSHINKNPTPPDEAWQASHARFPTLPLRAPIGNDRLQTVAFRRLLSRNARQIT